MGDLSEIRTNDRFKVGISSEIVKILEVDGSSSRIRVLRPVEFVGISHTQSTILESIPRVFRFDSSLSRTLSNNEDLENEGIFPTREDIEIYFNPSDSIGTSHSNPDNETGIGNTITINNPGAVSYTHLTLPTNREV